LDALIAAQIQFKEEEYLNELIQKEERMRENLIDEPVTLQAQLLTNDILRFVESYSTVTKNEFFTLRSIWEPQLYLLAMEFIADYVSRLNAHCSSRIFLFYYVSSKEDLARIRHGNGFLQGTVLNKSLRAAFQAAMNRSKYVDQSDTVSYFGWIVAISHHERIQLDETIVERNMDDTTKNSFFCTNSCQAVLPLACFDVSEQRCFADPIFNGLERVCSDFFSYLRRIDSQHEGLHQRVSL
jgi:hypothetical protein